MNIYALQTVRYGSKSVAHKNTLIIENKPLFLYNCDYAQKCKQINKTYISTDIPTILNNPKSDLWKNYRIIKRPKNLCTDTSSHYDTIIHGLNYIENDISNNVDILVILLGNNRGAFTTDLTKGINYLIKDNTLDSCISVGKYNMFNPYRAYRIDQGMLNTRVPQTIIDLEKQSKDANDKNAFGDTYFFNGSFWICKRKTLIKNNGLLPFPWLGKNIKPIVQDSSIMELDDNWQIKLM